jgi:hypothetical protein
VAARPLDWLVVGLLLFGFTATNISLLFLLTDGFLFIFGLRRIPSPEKRTNTQELFAMDFLILAASFPLYPIVLHSYSCFLGVRLRSSLSS